jgi:hypothetical protein
MLIVNKTADFSKPGEPLLLIFNRRMYFAQQTLKRRRRDLF